MARWRGAAVDAVKMRAELSKTFRFDAAHRLPNVPAEHRCAGLHGHRYHVTVTVAGEVDERLGWVMDFGEINEVVGPLIKRLLHKKVQANCDNMLAAIKSEAEKAQKI